MDKNTDWPEFIRLTMDEKPRRMAVKALQYFGDFTGYAVELGCGSGVDAISLAERGWKVYAVDSTSDGFDNIRKKLPDDKKDSIECVQARFEDMLVPEADLIYSSFSIPFCRPGAFDSFWGKIVAAIRPGGRFIGNLFGVNDEWAYMTDATFLTREQALGLFRDFDVEYFKELNQEGPAVLTPTKFWHLFDVVARKR